MHTLIEKLAVSTPTSANVAAYRGLFTQPRHEQLNGHRTQAFRFTGLARAGYCYGSDARALLPWPRGVGDGTILSHLRRSFFNL